MSQIPQPQPFLVSNDPIHTNRIGLTTLATTLRPMLSPTRVAGEPDNAVVVDRCPCSMTPMVTNYPAQCLVDVRRIAVPEASWSMVLRRRQRSTDMPLCLQRPFALKPRPLRSSSSVVT